MASAPRLRDDPLGGRQVADPPRRPAPEEREPYRARTRQSPQSRPAPPPAGAASRQPGGVRQRLRRGDRVRQTGRQPRPGLAAPRAPERSRGRLATSSVYKASAG